MVRSMHTARAIGPLLRGWRERRRQTQLGLSLDTGISSRHLSFLETGRARPSREMVLRLAERLDVPLRAQNELLLAAGFAPEYNERGLDDAALAQARRAIELVLQGHLPFPALAVDQRWTLIMANAASTALMSGVAPALLASPVNVLRLSLHPDGVAPRIVNLHEWRSHLLERLARDAVASGDAALAALHDELSGYPSGEPGPAVDPAFADVAVPLRLRHGGRELAFISTRTTFGTATDVTVAELSIESFFPTNDETREAMRSLVAG